MRRALRDNGLGLFFGAIFVAALVGQALTGHAAYNEEQLTHDGKPVSLGRYITSSSFGQAVMENWQSEYLQFTLYILLTVWLVQRGSPESKAIDDAGLGSDERARVGRHAGPCSPAWARGGGWRRWVYSNSLVGAMLTIFLWAWLAQSLTGWSDYNADQIEHGKPTVTWTGYLGSPTFWESTFQNWQSEFLAVGSMAVFSVYLRQRGSPESKPVGAAHEDTAITG